MRVPAITACYLAILGLVYATSVPTPATHWNNLLF